MTGPVGLATSWDSAWAAALAELEMDVEAAERMLTLDRIAEAPPAGWTPPSGLGPLPATLLDRAKALLSRQLEVGRRLAEAAELSRRQLAAAQAHRATAESAPVYIDLAG